MLRMPILAIFSDWLRAHGRTQHEIDRYALRFARLRPLEPTTCPQCFLDATGDETEQPLMLLERHGNEVPMFCPRCRAMFKIPVEYVPVA